MNSPYTHRGRGEPDPKWTDDDSAAFKDKSLAHTIDMLRKAREELKKSNDKAEEKCDD